MRNPMLRAMLGLPLLGLALAAGAREPLTPVPEPDHGKRSPDELRADPKLAPAICAIEDGCSLSHPRSKVCVHPDVQHAIDGGFRVTRAGSFGIEHRLTKSQRRAIREMNAMHREPGGGRDNG